MAGPFTHFLIADAAKRRRSLLGPFLYRILNRHSEFLYLGAVSPDLPYLSLKTGTVNWADLMHYKTTNGIVLHGYADIKNTWAEGPLGPTDERILAWLFGYVSHLIVDATIHPIVEAIVGPYEENSKEHQLCESTQDSLIYHQVKKMDVRYTEFSSLLKFCGQQEEHFEALMEFWRKQTQRTYPDTGEEPKPSLWFITYSNAIDAAEGGSSIVALFRHAGIANRLLYKTRDEIAEKYPEDQEKYYTKVRMPGGATGRFRAVGFDRAVNNVVDAWHRMYDGFESAVQIAEVIRNWNLDTGVDMDSSDQIKTYWV
jgi:hypothetical protein